MKQHTSLPPAPVAPPTPIAPRIVLVVVLACVLALMVVPYGAIEFLRGQFAWANRVADVFDEIMPGGDLDHVAAFAVLGVAVWFAFPAARAWRVVLAFVAMGALSELVQLWMPGRRPELWHAVLDVAGGLAGYGLAWLVGFASRPEADGLAPPAR
ncbi:VanZ family protein [Ramlibacter alkalitolerans]|uniref:VanZ family protein n=1 Tax=Ramlibacter alkalitolerans TaxID=2039631 RepID=A0ABS1JH58_9BURK|nr:VanZ family protein [Ramlibacter alkalitolerans]MBL0423552.1 VanZ family protein [Ramlibacter alkalitolerans]